MTGLSEPMAGGALARLRRFAGQEPGVERCDLCRRELAEEHDHLLELAARRLVCACPACALLFEHEAKGRFKRVPRRVRRLTDFRLTDAQWDGLRVPIDLAFFFRSSREGRPVAWYPSPAGATESLLSLETWEDIADANPVLREMADDVEALLANRVGAGRGAEPEYFVAPADQCYKLVGLIRTHWRGLSGGTEVWREIAEFFADLRRRSEGRFRA